MIPPKNRKKNIIIGRKCWNAVHVKSLKYWETDCMWKLWNADYMSNHSHKRLYSKLMDPNLFLMWDGILELEGFPRTIQ